MFNTRQSRDLSRRNILWLEGRDVIIAPITPPFQFFEKICQKVTKQNIQINKNDPNFIIGFSGRGLNGVWKIAVVKWSGKIGAK